MIGRKRLYNRNRVKAKGRKVRNLTNGKLYTTKKQSISSVLRSKKALERLDCSLMMKATTANSTPEVITRRGISFSRFLKNNPGFGSRRMRQCYIDNPELREVRREAMKWIQDTMGLPTTDPDMARKVAFKIRHFKNGVQVIRYVDCEREHSTGVVRTG